MTGGGLSCGLIGGKDSYHPICCIWAFGNYCSFKGKIMLKRKEKVLLVYI